MLRKTGSIIFVCASLAAAATVPLATSVSVGAATVTQVKPHIFRTWTRTQAVTAAAALQSFRPRRMTAQVSSAARTRAAFGTRASDAMALIEQELGPRFVSAAIDPSVGNRLVVHVAGAASTLRSPTLVGLDGSDSEVRIVEEAPSATPLTTAYAAARRMLGTTVAGSKIVSVAEDDMAAQVVVRVSRVTPAVVDRFGGTGSSYRIERAQPEHPTDGGQFGNELFRDQPPVAGGETLEAGSTAFTTHRNGAWVVITAGHVDSHVPGQYVLGNRDDPNSPLTVLGPMVARHIDDGSGVDAGAVSVPATPTPRNCIVLSASVCKPVSFQTQTIVQGMPIVKVGTTTGTTTGVVTYPLGSGVGVSSAIVTDACVMGGDSGGPLLIDNGGTFNPIGITSSVNTLDCNDPTFASAFQSWLAACPTLGVDNCPAPPPTVAGSMALTGLGGNDKVYATNSVGAIYTKAYVAGWQSWSAVHALPGVPLSRPTAIVIPTIREDVYARDATGHIWTDHYLPGASPPGWQPWISLGTAPGGIAFASDPTVIVGPTGSEDVFATDASGHIWHDDFVTGVGGSGWQLVPGGPGGSPSVFAGKPVVIVGYSGSCMTSPCKFSWNSEVIYAADAQGAVWRNFKAPGQDWQGWESTSGFSNAPPLSNLVANIDPQGNEDVFAQDSAGNIWTFFWTLAAGNTGEWTSIGKPAGVSLSNPTVVVGLQGAESVFAQDNTGKIWQNGFTTSWQGWVSRGAPAGVTLANPTIHFGVLGGESIYARDSTGHIWQDPYSTSWQGWSDLGTPPG